MTTICQKKYPHFVKSTNSRYAFCVAFHDAVGRRIRRFFDKKKEAESFVREMTTSLHQQGAVGAAMDARERAEWFAAKQALATAGAKVSVLGAVQAFLRDHPPGQKDALFADASAEFVESKRRLQRRLRTLEALENSLTNFARTRGILRCSDITPREVEAWVFEHGKRAQTAVGRLTVIRGFCRWACKPRNGFLATDPTADIERPRVKTRVPVTLSEVEARQCLAFADGQRVDFRLYVYLCVLAGLRQSEALEIPSSALAAAARNGVLAVVGIGKRGMSQRQVPVPERLQAVLRECTAVRPKMLPKLFRAMAVASGAGNRWGVDILRHTWVSHRLAFTGNAARTAMEAGHDQATMSRYYVSPKTEDEAKRYFEG